LGRVASPRESDTRLRADALKSLSNHTLLLFRKDICDLDNTLKRYITILTNTPPYAIHGRLAIGVPSLRLETRFEYLIAKLKGARQGCRQGMAIRGSRIRTERDGKRRGPQTERVALNRRGYSKTLPYVTLPHVHQMRFRGGCDSRRDAAHPAPAVSRRAIPRKSAARITTPKLPSQHARKRYFKARRPFTCWLASHPLNARRYGTREQWNPRPKRYTTIIIYNIRAHATTTRRYRTIVGPF